ncbi:hypothetical protein G9A89_021284 [Geosiphon pyriformis]|nr:hypothetical protein G9A89_021284 [Geosiphon pyriformis]
MEEKCLVEETSFNYSEGSVLAGGDHNQTPMGSKVKTKKALGKPLRKIDFLPSSDDNNVLLDASLVLPPPVKNLVNVSVQKSFALDIGLDKMKIPVGTSAEAVCTALSEFGVIKLIKMQLVGLWQKAIIEFKEQSQADFLANRWSILIGKDAIKEIFIEHCSILYLWKQMLMTSGTLLARCAIVCFESAKSLDAVMKTTLILRGAHLCWSYLGFATCAKCERLGHTFLDCGIGRKLFSGRLSHQMLSDSDKSRLATIYAKCSAFVTRPVAFDDALWASVVKADIVINEGLDMATGGETTAEVVVFDPAVILKMEKTLNNFSVTVMSLLAKMDNTDSNNIIHWHKEIDNVISIFMELKLKEKVCPWIVNKFDGVWVFTSGLESGYLGASVVIVMNFLLARHVSKISEVSGWLLFIKLLFKNKLLVSILGLYVGASLVAQFFQAGSINSLIVKVVNESSFIIFGGDFNEDRSHKSTSFNKCVDLRLVNSLVNSLAVKEPIWANSRNVMKTIDFVFVSPILVNVIVHQEVLGIGEHFDMDHNAVFMSVGLGGLLDMQLVSLRKQANRNHWKFDIRNANKVKWFEFRNNTAVNAVMFSDAFGFTVRFSDLDTMWDIICKIMVLLAGSVFKKKWFKDFDNISPRSLPVVKSLFFSGSNFNLICSVLAKARKLYCTAKLLESKHAKEFYIKQVIARRIESFELDKDYIIKSVLEHPFHKVVLDHLVVGNELILEPNLIKFKPLDYVFNGAFLGVMCLISLDEMSAVVKNLSDEKTTGLSVLDMLLVFLNSYLVSESPYEWESVLMNTHPIALIETACKILSKILLDRISSVCSTFNVLHGDNFLVLKGTTTQSPIFAIGFVVKDALEKNRELWLAYDSVGWEHLRRSLVRIKMCDRFIRFFNSIYNSHVNRVITNFGLIDGYYVHDELDQGEVFLSLLWHIFYNSLLCEVKKQENVCDSQAGLILFLAAGAFVDNTIWIVAIPINCQITNPHLTISGLPISIVKKKESHHYLSIFLSTESLSKPSLAKAYSDVWFFVNFVLRKVISDKQFTYLMSAVLFPIISYKTQFSFISISVCNKWDVLIHKGLKSKLRLPSDFPNDVLYYPLLYNLKTFEQIQAENKSATVIDFANSIDILGRLFSHKSHDLQVFNWCPRHPLLFSACVDANSLNNFLAGVVHIFSGCNLSLGNSLACAFHFRDGTPMSMVLGEPYFLKCVLSLKHYGIAFVEQLRDQNGGIFDWKTFKRWKRLDSRGLVLFWFDLSVHFLGGDVLLSGCFLLMDSGTVSDIH